MVLSIIYFFKDINELLPISHEATLNHGSKTVTSVTIDANGNRLATGGYDYEVKLWDFAGMDSSMRWFRSFEPFEKYQKFLFYTFFVVSSFFVIKIFSL